MNAEKLSKLQAQVRIGGKGTPRRKIKKHVKTTGDDKKTDAILKKLHCQPIPAIEEVNMFKIDGRVLHFRIPKIEASIGSNLFVVRGTPEDKEMAELVPGVLPQLGHENLQMLRKLAESYEAAAKGKGAAAGADDDVPDLVENFDDAIKEVD